MQNYLLQHTSARLDVQLGATLMNHMMRLPLRYYETRRVGDTVAQVREMENIRQFFTGSTITAVLDLLFVVVFVAVMLLYSVTLTLFVLFFSLIFIGISLVMRPLMKSALEEKFSRGAENQAFLVESVTGIHTIKSLAVEPIMTRKWEAILAKYVNASFKANQVGALGANLGNTIQQFSTIAIISVGTMQVMSGSLSVGQLIAIQMLSVRVISPLVRIVQLWQEFQQVGISINRLGDIMNTPVEPRASNLNTTPLVGKIQFTNVAFKYKDKSILKDLSFVAMPDQVVGIVGRSGSGKSTLAKLLQKMYLADSGSIMVDGVDIRQIDYSWLRRQIGVVLQENFLFNGTIREAIAIQKQTASMKEIIEVAELAGAHDFIMELEHQYETQIGERGMSLSGGQRQRIAIARALINNPRILIFDEATSALDYESERIIKENLATICKGRTVFMIAHRLSTIQNADSILVMDGGKVVDTGTHAELINRKGLYHSLFSVQENYAQPTSYQRKA
jgi:subfamily B ATP-binding cassette protein HlyB/CyaB